MIFGAHCSTGGGVYRALQRAREIKGDIVQIFVKNNMRWFGKPQAEADLRLYADELATSRFHCVFGHTGYLINLGAAPSGNRDRSIQSLIQEIQFAAALKLPFLVLHPGAHLGAGEAVGIGHIVAGLDEVFQATKNCTVRLALENTAGQGSCLGNKIEHLATLFERVKNPDRLGICLDTAHLFAAGYDIRTQFGWESVIAKVESMIGLEQIVAFHLNDSKTELGSRVDRHEHIGQGKIGRKGFRHIVSDERFVRIPGCLETPKGEDLREDIENLTVLRALARSAKRKTVLAGK